MLTCLCMGREHQGQPICFESKPAPNRIGNHSARHMDLGRGRHSDRSDRKSKRSDRHMDEQTQGGSTPRSMGYSMNKDRARSMDYTTNTDLARSMDYNTNRDRKRRHDSHTGGSSSCPDLMTRDTPKLVYTSSTHASLSPHMFSMSTLGWRL